MSAFWTAITILGYMVTLALIRWVLLLKKRHPGSTVAWIMVILLIPYLGGLLFLVFGVNRVERRARRKHLASETIGREIPNVASFQLAPGEGVDPRQIPLIRLATRIADTVPTVGNDIEVLGDTNRTLGLIEQAVLAARQTIHLEYYIYRSDRTGKRLRDLLIQKARDGVKVRFLYDGVGSMWLTRRFLKPMRDAGIEVASFLPGPSFRERWSINLRNHRKIVVVDGRIGFTGGMNIGNEYLGRDPHVGYWRDMHLRMKGPSVLQLQQVFVEDWFYATGASLIQPEIFPKPTENGPVTVQVVASGPAGDSEEMHWLMFAALNEARETIHLTTSYFVPPPALVSALEAAAYRGVRVRLMLAGKAIFRWTVLAGRSYYDSLLDAGVEIYEYTRGLQHAKTLTIDGHWSLVGTPNFDARSLFLNFEVAVAIYDKRTAELLEREFDKDVEHAKRIDSAEWARRPLRHILAENTCRLFAPVL
jgi:cardiolipin synthase